MPDEPVINPMGIKTAHITKVMEITAPVISLMALWVACLPVKLEVSIFPCTASTTTIASSTTIPMASTRANNVNILMVKPNTSRKKNVPTIATGTAIAGIIVDRMSCRNKNTTKKTNMKASINVERT
ncbi:hypothetical protein D3C81_1152990 [compost metagenome]